MSLSVRELVISHATIVEATVNVFDFHDDSEHVGADCMLKPDFPEKTSAELF